MHDFTRYGLILALCCFTNFIGAQFSGPEVYFEAECVDRSGTDYIVGGDVAASNDRYLTARPRAIDGPQTPVLKTFSYDFNLDVPFIELLSINVFGRLRATVATQSLLQVRVNGSQWFFFQGSIEPSDTFAWIEAPERLNNLRQGSNTVEIAISEVGTQLDKLYFTIGDQVPTGMGGMAVNCGNYDFEPNMDPIAVARAEPQTGTAPLSVQLDGSASFDDDGTIERYEWAWENGGSASGPTPLVEFGTGDYNVTLTVTDDFNATATDEVRIVVEEPVVDGTTSEFWLEAECAEFGAAWTTINDFEAARGAALVYNGPNAMSAPPADLPENRIRFTLDDVEAGNYSLFARIDAPGPLSDSYWVRINGGEWYAWKSGIRQSVGYRWNRYPDVPVTLMSGINVVDFAYRENGTVLDKLHLNKTGIRPAVGPGMMATNCADEEATRFALEIECGMLGAGWKVSNSQMTSGGKFVRFAGPSGIAEPMNPDPSRMITFNIDISVPTTYYGYVRLSAPNVGSNSLWARVDGGDWIKMWKETDGRQLSTQGYEWRRLADNGLPVSFDLEVGEHTITIVNRESNTRLDKFYLTAEESLPVGFGPDADNCGFVIAPAIAAVTKSVQLAEESAINLYPNPAMDELNLDLSSDYTGRIRLEVYSYTGQRISESYLDKVSEQLLTNVRVSDLVAGMYTLRVTEGRNTQSRTFVKR